MSTNKYISPYVKPDDVEAVQYLNNKDFSLVESPTFFRTPLGYESMDPRTFDSPRAQRLALNRPPIQTKNTDPLTDIYTKENTFGVYAGVYPDYASIKGGNIIYKIFPGDGPYMSPLYVLPSEVTPTIYTDPMESKPTIYVKRRMFEKNNNLFPYTFDQDQIQFREDIMSRQSRNNNKNSYDLYQKFKD
jgi:hypothetical protein